jgi:hypothetical protein
MAASPISISASCVATFLNASPETRLKKLVPFKHKNVGEGAGRSGHYKPMINAAAEYHRVGNNHGVFQRVIAAMTLIQEDQSLSRIQRTKGTSNIDAILAYERIYGRRTFEFLPNRRLSFEVGGVTVTAQPDMWVVDENGNQTLFKIGAATSKRRDYIDFMLHLIRKAAAASRQRIGTRIRGSNIVWLNVATGEEIISHLPLTHFNRTIANACREIAALWPLVPDPRVATLITAAIDGEGRVGEQRQPRPTVPN